MIGIFLYFIFVLNLTRTLGRDGDATRPTRPTTTRINHLSFLNLLPFPLPTRPRPRPRPIPKRQPSQAPHAQSMRFNEPLRRFLTRFLLVRHVV